MSAPTGSGVKTALDDPSLFINRELSLVAFHRRVLDQATDEAVPLIERLRFLTITSSILDEFFEIRVAGLKEQIAYGISKTGPDGLTPMETLVRLREAVLALVERQYAVLNDQLLPALDAEGIRILKRKIWSEKVQAWVTDYFRREVFPVVTPVGLDPAHPFPEVVNKSLNFVVTLEGTDSYGRSSRVAVVQAPRVLPRLIALPEEVGGGPYAFVLLSSVIHAHVDELFPGMKILGCDQFRVTRNSDLWVDEEEIEDLLHALKGELPRRHYGDAVRLEVSDTCTEEMKTFLLERFGLDEIDLYSVNGPVNLHRLEALCELIDRPDLKYPPFVPGTPAGLEHDPDVFELLRERDVLLHHPYETFAPVLAMLRRAASDPDVLAVKQTVYRTGKDSPVAEALVDAARAGKEVTAVIELRARFDEAANIELATRLKDAGATVAYGVVGYKTHAKLMLIVRREADGPRRYVHLGTGNYNPVTARSYTDLGLMSSDRELGEDVHALFQQLTGLGRAGPLRKLIQSPFDLHGRLVSLIEREAAEARAGRDARIVAKLNALIEPRIIRALYDASRAGVPIDLVVRGVCCLKPGVPGVSETIRVRSLVGRFLEHHRAFYFHAGGARTVLCSSADWMPRNFFRRVEVAFPVEDPALKERVVREVLEAPLEDERQAWAMRPDGLYERPTGGAEPPAQDRLLALLAPRRG